MSSISFDARTRLREMDKQPLIWARTREGFLLQVCLLLELLGVKDVQLHDLESNLAIKDLKAGITTPWAKQVIDRAMAILSSRSPPASP